jgi:hypothetical protein
LQDCNHSAAICQARLPDSPILPFPGSEKALHSEQRVVAGGIAVAVGSAVEDLDLGELLDDALKRFAVMIDYVA